MARRTLPSEDEWRNVGDAKKRKQIQDRLAQRARRQRLREAKNIAEQLEEQDETQEEEDTQQPEHETEASRSLVSTTASFKGLLDMVPQRLNIAMGDCPFARLKSNYAERSSSSENSLVVNDFSPVNMADVVGRTAFSPSSQALIPSPSGQPPFPTTVSGALYVNGQILGLSCSTVVPAKSSPARSDVPASLKPTELQLITIHSIWIDRFPFPKMRDSMISLSGVVDDEEVLKDVILMDSFEIVPGRAPWDPLAWKIKRPFAEKWGYLFFR